MGVGNEVMPSTTPTPDGVHDLRRCVRDLVAVSTLPAVWENADRSGVGRDLGVAEGVWHVGVDLRDDYPAVGAGLFDRGRQNVHFDAERELALAWQ